MPTVAMGPASVILATLETTALKVGEWEAPEPALFMRVPREWIIIHFVDMLHPCVSHSVDGEVMPWTRCGDYFCFNGGTCQNDTCQCSEGFGGDYCLYSGGCA